jgi:hypothetical protein
VTVLYGDDVEADGLSGLIPPIGPVGRDADLNRTDPVLGASGKHKQESESEAEHNFFTIAQAEMGEDPTDGQRSIQRSQWLVGTR